VSKSERIRELLQTTDHSTGEIADIVGCRIEYVRVVRQRMKGNCASTRWRKNNRDLQNERRRIRYESDPEFRERMKKAWRDHYVKNRQRYIKYSAEYRAKKYTEDPEYREKIKAYRRDLYARKKAEREART